MSDENPIPLFSSGGNSPVEPASEGSKSVGEISAQVAAQYAANGDPAQSAVPRPRKPRSDKGVPRNRKSGVEMDPAKSKIVAVSENGEAIGFSVDKQIVEKTVKVTIGTIDGIMVRKIGNTALSLGADNALASELANNAGLRTTELELMGELSGIIAEKYGLLTGYAPELLLCLLLGEWGGRVYLVMRRLNVLAEEQKEKAKRLNVSTPSSDKDRNNG